ncbi:MAG: alpha/beta hydrolase, partial [Halioglobus sp.]
TLTPDQLSALRRQLPSFPRPAAAVLELDAYCHYYGIDFVDRDPTLTHLVGRVASGEFSLAVNLWQRPAARGNLLLVHGYTDHAGLFGHLIAWGLSNNLNVLIFDLPGHGLSSGAPAAIDSFGQYSQAVDDVLAAASLPALPLYALAQSTGCAALMDYAQHHTSRGGWPFDKVAFLAPLVRPLRWRWARLASRLLSPFTDGLERTISRNTSDGAFMAILTHDPLQPAKLSFRWMRALAKWLAQLQDEDFGLGPILIVQGDDDGTVDRHYNVPVVESLFPGSRVEYLAGAGHQLANEAPAIREHYQSLLDEWFGLVEPESRQLSQ